jgi:hypothetical protein
MSSDDGRIPLFEREGFIICFEALDEMDSVRDHFKRTGMEKKQIDSLQRKLGSGKAVWFQAIVSAWKDGRQLGEASLGGCFYSSFEEFYKTEGDYFDDLANQAIAEAKEKACTK